MKIAINAIRVSKKSGGGLETYIINLVNELAKIISRINTNDNELTRIKNIEFDVYTLYPEHFPEVKPERIINPVNVVAQFIGWIKKLIIISQQNIMSDKSDDSLSIWKKILPSGGDTLRILWTQFIFPFYLLTRKYDILFSPTQLDALVLCPIPQIITIHDTIPLLFPEYKHKQKIYLKYLLPMILRKVKRVITISENTKNDVVRFYNVPKEKISAIHYGINKSNLVVSEEDIGNFKRKNGLDRYILCISSNFPHKNLLRLIEAFYIVKNQQEDVSLLIVGYQEKKYQTEMNKKISELVLKNKIKILGHFPQNQLSTIYAGAELFVFPSLYEGFGLPPLEAMTYSCPVVVSNTSSLPEVVGDAGVYVNSYNPEDIANGIIKVLTDENLRHNLIKKGFEQVKKFSWEKAARETLKVFEENLS